MTTNEQKAIVQEAVKAASLRWLTAFNSGNAQACAEQYEQSAVMYARPFGTFYSADEIRTFWQNLIDEGFANVEYINPELNVIDEASGVLTSNWKMNKTGRVIHKELSVLQPDGTAKLRADDFEATE